jgi:hypothetical protein
MQSANLVARVKAILTTPKTEWPQIAIEPASIGGLYTGYIAILSAIPVVASFIKSSLIGTSFMGITVRVPIVAGITAAILGYALSLLLSFVMAWIVNALAPTFSGQKNQIQALKTVAYAWTAYWVAGVATIVPWLGWLVVLAGGIYTIYLLYLGLPSTMQCPPDKAAGYTALSIVIAVVLGWVISFIVGMVLGGALLGGAAMGSVHLDGGNSDSVSVDPNSTLGRLAAMGQHAEQASQELQAAQKSGDTGAQQAAMGKMIVAAIGGDGKVESVSAEQIKSFLPDSVLGLKRQSLSAQRNGAMGMQVSEANGEYGEGDGDGAHISLEVTDTGSMKGLMAIAGSMSPEEDKQTDHGYDKTYTESGRLTHETWDTQSKSGEYSVVIGQRFTVKASGRADGIDQLKQAVGAVDLGRLESLRGQGVASN